MDTVAMAATDVEFLAHGPERCEIAVGPRTYSLSADRDALESLADVVMHVVPRMRQSVPVRRQLSSADAGRLAPFVERFRDMGILLFPDNGTTIEDEPARCLYSYICRRAEDPDRVFTALRAKRVHLSGPEQLVMVWSRLLTEQGLTVSATGADGAEPGGAERGAGVAALTVVASADEAALAAVNRSLCADRAPWLPVLFGPRRARIGPWVQVGQSACLRCFRPPVPGTERARRQGSGAGWATLQPGCLYWTGGLITHLALRALLPRGAEHPWGRVTTVDVVAGEQESVTAWRDPFCPDCARHAPAPQEWVAL
jgi:hypothetical protein